MNNYEKLLYKSNRRRRQLRILMQKNKQLKEKINKAIKYIEENSYDFTDYQFGIAIKSYAFDRNANPIELLEILKGVDK